MPALPRPARPRASAIGALLVLTLFAGCGDDGGGPAVDTTAPDPAATSGSAPSESPSGSAAGDAPACEAVWVTGRSIPRGFDGCEVDGTLVEADVIGCSSGQRFVTYDDRWYGVLGGAVREGTSPLDQDREYRASVASCRG